MSARKCEIIVGDALERLRGLPSGIARVCMTSPPYWGLRDYGTGKWGGGDPECDHRELRGGIGAASQKQVGSAGASTTYRFRDYCKKCGAVRIDSQLGLEASPGEYVEKLVEVFAEVRRVLADDGTLWLNLGDCYATGAGKGGGAPGGGEQGERWRGTRESSRRDRAPVGPMTQPNRMAIPGLKAKDLVGIPWRVAFALQADGWYLRSEIIWAKPNPMPESIEDRPTKAHEQVFLLSKAQRYFYNAAAISEPALQPMGEPVLTGQHKALALGRCGSSSALGTNQGPSTRNRRSVWTISTSPFRGAHFAVMPEALAEPCILAGSEPGDLVIDPFAGAGTTGLVALRALRRFLGIELNPEYAEIARARLARYSDQGEIFPGGS